jgi:hypothetical protein
MYNSFFIILKEGVMIKFLLTVVVGLVLFSLIPADFIKDNVSVLSELHTATQNLIAPLLSSSSETITATSQK